MSVPTAAALKMGVGFPLTNLPGTSDDTNRILSTQCQHQPTELLNECGICKQVNDQHFLAKCDTCKLYYHLGCLTPPLTRHPKKSKIYGWQCSECDEDNPDGVVQLASGPRKSRTKYSKDGTIVPVETNHSISNGNDTAESAPNSLSPSSNQSDRKPTIRTEKNKPSAFSTNSPSASCANLSTPEPSKNNEIKNVKRRFKRKNVGNMASIEAATVSRANEENELVCGDSTISLTNIVEPVEAPPSKVKRRKKIKAKEQAANTTNTTQSDSSNINRNTDAELTAMKPRNGVEIESTKTTSVEIEAKTIGIGSPSHKLNRKRRKDKHRSKERSDRSSSKERKKKKKRKNHDEDKLPVNFPLADGVPKIRIKVNYMYCK